MPLTASQAARRFHVKGRQQMREHRPPDSSALTGALSWACLLTAVGGPLLVPLYMAEQPLLGGWPLFYWYQLMWIPLSAILLTGAYLLTRHKDARRRARKR